MMWLGLRRSPSKLRGACSLRRTVRGALLVLMPDWGWLRLMLASGRAWRLWPLLPLRTLLPLRLSLLRDGWAVRERVAEPLAAEDLVSWRGFCSRMAVLRLLLLLLRTLLPLRLLLTLLLRLAWLPLLREGWLTADWLRDWLRLTEPSPLVLPDWLALRFCEEGAETEEVGRLPPPVRELPPPDPLRELLPPLV